MSQHNYLMPVPFSSSIDKTCKKGNIVMIKYVIVHTKKCSIVLSEFEASTYVHYYLPHTNSCCYIYIEKIVPTYVFRNQMCKMNPS